MAIDDIDIDYGNGPSGAGSYFTRGLGGGVTWNTDISSRMAQSLMSGTPGTQGGLSVSNDITGIETSPEIDGSGLVQQSQYGIDPSTQQYINRSVADALRNSAPSEMLSSKEYYPLGNEPIEVGSFSTPLLSGSLFSAGAAEIPYEMLYAKQRARETQEAIMNEKRNRQLNWDLALTKDALHNEVFVNQQNKDWIPWVNEKIDKLKADRSVRPEDYYEIITGSQEYKEKQLKWNNVANGYDQVFDWATQTIMFKNEQAVPASTTTSKITTKDKEASSAGSGRTKTSTGEEQYSQEYETSKTGAVAAVDVPYVSDYSYGVAQRFMNEIRKSSVDIEALTDIMNEMQHAKSMDKIINETADVMNANIESEMIKAAVDNKWITTDKENGYNILKTTGVKNSRSPEIKKDLREIYDSQYKYVEEKFRPDFETEFYPQAISALIKKEELTFEKLSKTSAYEYGMLDLAKKNSQKPPIQPVNGKEQFNTMYGTAELNTYNKIMVPYGEPAMKFSGSISKEYDPVNGKWVTSTPGQMDFLYMGSMEIDAGGQRIPVGVIRKWNPRLQEYDRVTIVPGSDVEQPATYYRYNREVLPAIDYTPSKVTSSDVTYYGDVNNPINNPQQQPAMVTPNADGTNVTITNTGGGKAGSSNYSQQENKWY
jgi:hypothetical protein